LWNGMWTFLTTPMMSVNCRLTNRTWAASASSNTRCFIAALSVLCILSYLTYQRLRRAALELRHVAPSLGGATAAQCAADLQRQLQVEPRLGIFEIDAAEQLLDPLESV